MEITCTRCHRAVEEDSSYCPACGLPKLVYSPEETNGQVPYEEWNAPAQDASCVDWKTALRFAFLVAVPAGILCSGLSPVGFFGLLWMASAAVWAVILYMRSKQPAWITMGAGARIGLVTGILAGWLAFSISGSTLFVERFVLHQSSQIDSEWKTRVALSQQMAQQWTAGVSAPDVTEAQKMRAQVQSFMVSPEGHAGIEAFGFAANAVFLLFFAMGGGAFGARMIARRRKPQV
jgi:hypothetical protein